MLGCNIITSTYIYIYNNIIISLSFYIFLENWSEKNKTLHILRRIKFCFFWYQYQLYSSKNYRADAISLGPTCFSFSLNNFCLEMFFWISEHVVHYEYNVFSSINICNYAKYGSFTCSDLSKWTPYGFIFFHWWTFFVLKIISWNFKKFSFLTWCGHECLYMYAHT